MQRTTLTLRRAILPAASMLLAVLQYAVAQTQPCSAEIDIGDSAYAKFDNIRALDHYTLAFRTCPDNYEATTKMTRALIDAGEDINAKKSESLFVKGLRYADTLRLRYPDSGQSYFLTAIAAANLAQIKVGMKRIPYAMIIDGNIRKSIARDPLFAPAFVVLGSYCREVAVANPVLKMLVGLFYGWKPKGTLDESEQALKQALVLDPGNIYAHLELARTYEVMGRKQDAIAHLEQLQELPNTWHQDKELKRKGRQILETLQK
jgi:tetratricopeptide (TPR) repeat protein